MAVEELDVAGLRVQRHPQSGPRVLFVHGAACAAWTWHNFMGQFAEQGYDCYAINLRGRPPNPELADLGAVRLADFVQDVCRVARQIRPEVLIGHSMGGAIVQAAALEVMPRALVLAAPAPVRGVRFRHPPMDGLMLRQSLRALLATVRQRPLQPNPRLLERLVLNCVPREQRAALISRFVDESSAAGADLLRGAVPADLADESFPRLVVGGRDDLTTVIGMLRELAAYQDAELMELEGHGHMFMLEPGWEHCGHKILTWLRRHNI